MPAIAGLDGAGSRHRARNSCTLRCAIPGYGPCYPPGRSMKRERILIVDSEPARRRLAPRRALRERLRRRGGLDRRGRPRARPELPARRGARGRGHSPTSTPPRWCPACARSGPTPRWWSRPLPDRLDAAVTALRAGAESYLVRPLDPGQVLVVAREGAREARPAPGRRGAPRVDPAPAPPRRRRPGAAGGDRGGEARRAHEGDRPRRRARRASGRPTSRRRCTRPRRGAIGRFVRVNCAGAVGGAARVRAVRARAGRLRRGGRAARRPLRAGERRDALPARGGADAARRCR